MLLDKANSAIIGAASASIPAAFSSRSSNLRCTRGLGYLVYLRMMFHFCADWAEGSISAEGGTSLFSEKNLPAWAMGMRLFWGVYFRVACHAIGHGRRIQQFSISIEFSKNACCLNSDYGRVPGWLIERFVSSLRTGFSAVAAECRLASCGIR